VNSEEASAVLRADPSIARALAAARSVDVALVGIGQMTEGATLLRGLHVSARDWDALLAGGAVGNVNTRFFDLDGRPVTYLEDRTVAVTWEELAAIPTVVAVAAGVEKVAAISGALKTGAVDVLVTDEPTARSLLRMAGQS
jgi:DNA-binding transcriptional regulator LsrR (DeoR family)